MAKLKDIKQKIKGRAQQIQGKINETVADVKIKIDKEND